MMQLMLLDVVTEYQAALDTLDLDVYDPDAIGVVDEAEQRLRAAVALAVRAVSN